MVVFDTRQCLVIDGNCPGIVTDELSVRNAIEVIGARHHIAAIHLGGLPAQAIHAVLDGACRHIFQQPALYQGIDVFWLERVCGHSAIAHVMQLAGDLAQHPLPIRLRAVTAIPIAIAQLFQLVVQVAHVYFPVW